MNQPNKIAFFKGFVRRRSPFLLVIRRQILLSKSVTWDLHRLEFVDRVLIDRQNPLRWVDRASKPSYCQSRSDWGFNASKSLTSELTGVNGLALFVCATAHIVVERTASLTDLFPHTAYIAFLQLLTNRSHTLPKWVAASRLNFRLIPSWIRSSSLFPSLIHAAKYNANYRSAPTEFVPLSLTVVLGLPFRAKNRIIALKQLYVSNLETPSICTALIVWHLNKQNHHSTFVKDRSGSSSGRSAITGAIVCALPFLQLRHLFLIDRHSFDPYLLLNNVSYLPSVPSFWFSLRSFRKNNSTSWCFQCSNIGCFALKSN